jgi:predicted O-linked N-acetylglucosamine transferase (SPINDLY family)
LQAQAVQHFSAGRWDEAQVLFKSLLARHAGDMVALYHLAAIALQLKNPAQALGYAERCVKRLSQPLSAVWVVHAMALQSNGRFEEALASFRRALAIDPRDTVALTNHGVLLLQMQRRQEGLDEFLKILDIDPRNTAALSNAATVLSELQGCREAAVVMYRRLVAVSPGHPYALGALCFEGLSLCDWSDFTRLEPLLLAPGAAAQRLATPFTLLAFSGSAQVQAMAARQFASDRYPAAATPLWHGERYGHRRLRVAYVSPDFKEHPVSHLMAGVLEQHDRARFEIFAVSLGDPDGSALRARIAAACEHFIDAAGQSPLQIASTLRAHEIDIAIDLAGYTLQGGIEAFAHRPAPLQVNYLGYPGTLGTAYHDFILADRQVIPVQDEPHYTESVWHLPDCYLPPAASVPATTRTPTRAECGLPEDAFVLCCFNHDFKIHPAVFGVWMELLQQRADCVLWLACRNDSSRQRLRDAAALAGVDPARLAFAPWLPRAEDHLARYRVADLFVDTVPYNGHTTAADALMAGLPVVTCVGDAFPARVARSLLRAAGLPELATADLADYRSLVLALRDDPQRLAALRSRLQANRATHALFDSARFCRNLEAAFVGMHERVVPAALAPATAPAPAVAA